MTYCVGVVLDDGMIFASDSRTNAGVDNFAAFCKMSVFEQAGERVIVLLSSGTLAGTQAVISLLKQRASAAQNSSKSTQAITGTSFSMAMSTPAEQPSLWNVKTMFDAAMLVADAMREIDRRDGKYLEKSGLEFNASFILGGQIKGEAMRLFRIYAEGNFIEAGLSTPFMQTGETKYGKPIIDRMITPKTSLADAAKCVLVSFDSTMRSNLSVGMPIDLICYKKDSLQIDMRRRFDDGDSYIATLRSEWSDGVREVFSRLPSLVW
jgi:putative proteasome-type protease